MRFENEIYQISDFDDRGSRVLLRLDQSSVDLGQTGVHQRFYGWPLAWTRSYGQGRVFYMALGHEASAWQDTRYQRILTNAILWSMRRLRHGSDMLPRERGTEAPRLCSRAAVVHRLSSTGQRQQTVDQT